MQGEIEAVAELENFADFSNVNPVTDEELSERYSTEERMFVVRLPKYSGLADATLEKSRLADVFDFRVVAIFREGQLNVMPRGKEVLVGGDLLLIEGQHEDMDVLRGLQELEIETSSVSANRGTLESERLTVMDATLDPRSNLAGKTVGELNFRERYGLELAGILREGGPVGAELAEERLQIGDALLLLGPHERLKLLSNDSDFLILTPLGQEPPDTRRAPLAAFIMLCVVLSVMAGYAHIAVAAVVGGSVMVLTGCLTMEARLSCDRLARDFSHCRHVASGYCDAGYGCCVIPGRPGHATTGRCRTVAGDYGTVCPHCDGHHDHSDGSTRGPDVTDRIVCYG